MGDEQQCQTHLVAQVFEQVQYLRLNRDVQRRDRLVGQDQLWLGHDRPGDADALPLAAGELVRVAVVVLGVEPDHFHDLAHATSPLHLRAELVNAQRLADDRAHRTARVQRGVRILKDDLHVAPERSQLAPRPAGDVLPVVDDLPAGGLDQASDEARESRLPAAGLTHQSERLSSLHFERDIIHRVHLPELVTEDDTAREREVLGQAAYDNQVVGATRLAWAGIRGVGVWSIAHRFGSHVG